MFVLFRSVLYRRFHCTHTNLDSLLPANSNLDRFSNLLSPSKKSKPIKNITSTSHQPNCDILLSDRSKCSRAVKTASSLTDERWLLDRSRTLMFKHFVMAPTENIPIVMENSSAVYIMS